MNKLCRKCDKMNEVHKPLFCPKNYTGSSKGMEAEGALRAFKQIHANGIKIGTVVLDDDSTTKAYLSHSWEDMKVSDKDWLRYKNNAKKQDKGKLPMEIPPLIFLADRNHRVRCFGGVLFRLAYAPMKTSQVSRADAHRLKKNIAY